MTTEIATYQTTLTEQMEFARAVVNRPEGGARSLLPESYRDNPGNVLIAVGLGQSMGLSPAESLYRIDVIQGKPTAGAELIAANVRKAGHKLRVQGDETTCTATIIRADDPDFPFTVTRDLEWARAMGLTGKDNYKKQPGTMLQWRAITAVARLACPEALYGVAYTADELYDTHGPDTQQRARGGLASALADQPPAPAERASEQPITDRTRAALFAVMGEVGITNDDDQRAFLTDTLGREVESRKTLTEAEGITAGKRLRAIQQGDATAEWAPSFDAEVVDEGATA